MSSAITEAVIGAFVHQTPNDMWVRNRAKNNTIHYDADTQTLYSYAMPIGTYIDGVVLVNTMRYSVTTAKHQSKMLSALDYDCVDLGWVNEFNLLHPNKSIVDIQVAVSYALRHEIKDIFADAHTRKQSSTLYRRLRAWLKHIDIAKSIDAVNGYANRAIDDHIDIVRACMGLPEATKDLLKTYEP